MKNLKVIYDEDLDEEFEKKLEEFLTQFGFEIWASGYNMLEGKRDIAFHKKEDT